MSVPENCQVLVVGGGPAGSYAAALLAREGIDVVVLEAEKFPRYHIGESMLPSMRHFLKFIEVDDRFKAHGFIKKNGAAFRLNKSQPEAYTDFIAAGGPDGHTWNVVRSEADDILFRYAGECGAKIFDATKVATVEFIQGSLNTDDSSELTPGQPVSATWSRKDGSSGIISFQYLIDASGRHGILSTKYLKNRKFNQNLKNVANWGYWRGGGLYGVGTHKEGSPFFEALQDASGWCWFIPLHDGTHSVGIVRNQELSIAKKHELGSPSTKDFYLQSLDQAPRIQKLLSQAELVSDIKSASDWSYSASTYALPHARLAGDAGCFIDPYFSSGVHLAILGGLSAAVTICASLKGDCDESIAASWHSKKIAQSYTRFYLVVSSAMRQIRSQDDPVIQDIDEEGFQRAFDIFRPVIQGTVDADSTGKLSQSEISKTIDFCIKAFANVSPDAKDSLMSKLAGVELDAQAGDPKAVAAMHDVEKTLTPEETEVLNILRSRRMIREDSLNIDSFKLDVIDELAPRMERGNLGLQNAQKTEATRSQLQSIAYLEGQRPGLRDTVDCNGKMSDMEPVDNKSASGNITQQPNGVKANGLAMAESKINGHTYTNGHVNGQGFGKAMQPLAAAAMVPDEASRHAVMNALHESAESFEEPFDMLMRLMNTGRQLAMIEVGYQLGIFKSLSDSVMPLTVKQLSEPHNADPELVSRILRYLASNRFISEVDKDVYTARKATHFLADEGMTGGIRFAYAFSNLAIHHVPDYLVEHNFKVPESGPWVFQQSSKTDLELYPWLKTQPDMLRNFQNMMTVPRGGDWLSVVTAPDLRANQLHRVAFVDVGGNVGHQVSRFKAVYPNVAGRLVLQDLPETIQKAPAMDGIELMPHDFFTQQPVKGAYYYYMRNILHNWDDQKAVEILRNLVPAMARDSQVLIDEIVLPNTGANTWSTGQDLQMMMMFGAKERTIEQWTELVERAGLRVHKVQTYAPVMRSSIIIAMLR